MQQIVKFNSSRAGELNYKHLAIFLHSDDQVVGGLIGATYWQWLYVRIVQEASPPEVLLGFVASGMGVSLFASGADARYGVGVVYRELSTPAPILEIAAAWRKHPVSSVLKDFLVLAKQAYSLSKRAIKDLAVTL